MNEGSDQAQHAVRMAAIVAGLGGLLFGYDTGVIAGALLFIREDLGIQDDEFAQGIIVSAAPIGAAFGAILAAAIGDKIGRRRAILISAVAFAVGSGIAAASNSVEVMVAGRLVLGMAIGLASASAPVYVSEVAPPDSRGRLVSFFQLAVTIGILVAYLVGLAFAPIEGWRWMVGLAIVPAALLGGGMLRMPHSPRWLIMAGERAAALKALKRVREPDQAALERELDEIEHSLEGADVSWREVFGPAIRPALIVGVGLAILQQVSGINTVIYYAPTIIEFSGIDSSSAAILAAVGVGIVNVAVTAYALRVLDRTGRRKPLMTGIAISTGSLIVLGIAFLGGGNGALDTAVLIGSMLVYIAGFAIGLGVAFWLLNAEIYPLEVRAKAAALGTTMNWTFNFIVSLAFLPLIAAIGRSETFWLFAAIGAVTLVFVWRLVPETKGKRLEEIGEELARRAGRKAA